MSRILLVTPDDRPPVAIDSPYQAVVDLGRAPASTYEQWSRNIGSPVFSLFDLNEGTDDLHRTRELLETGMGRVIDRFGIDWWDLLAQSVVPQIQQLMLIRRLARRLDRETEIHVTRPHFLATALQKATGGELSVLRRRNRAVAAIRRYSEAVRQLDSVQLRQIVHDKFDPEHAIRQRFARQYNALRGAHVLLPSAYVNVSRMGVGYAELLPEANFLLILARRSAVLQYLPHNVHARSLDAYFSANNDVEAEDLREQWRKLSRYLCSMADEFAISVGLLAGMECRIGAWLRVRDAWNKVFEREEIHACLSADDSNPYSRLPLMLSRARGVPALACHHGALDSRMAIKRNHADYYLAKTEMERDYLTRVCGVSREKLTLGGPSSIARPDCGNVVLSREVGCIVFFSEPFHVAGWRVEEVYRELLPPLFSLAQALGLELVFKLHPFESVKAHRRLLRRCGCRGKARVLQGEMPAEIWPRIKLAIAVQSTVAVDCAERGIPVWLCGWLADTCAGYAEQFARSGIATMLRRAEDIGTIPALLARERITRPIRQRIWKVIAPSTLNTMLRGNERSLTVSA